MGNTKKSFGCQSLGHPVDATVKQLNPVERNTTAEVPVKNTLTKKGNYSAVGLYFKHFFLKVPKVLVLAETRVLHSKTMNHNVTDHSKKYKKWKNFERKWEASAECNESCLKFVLHLLEMNK